MNENLNLVEILKDCPSGTKFYSTVHGEIFFEEIIDCASHPLSFVTPIGVARFTAKGRLFYDEDTECILFPSKDQIDWSKFTAPWYKKEKFDTKTLQPFDKVLVRDDCELEWQCDVFSHINYEPDYRSEMFPYKCTGCSYRYCIPYNEETKHLVGTTEEVPEFYRYWKD